MSRFVPALCLCLMLLGNASIKASDDQLTVFAASSLTDILPKLGDAWSNQTGQPMPRFSFAASAVMARQIVAGAPADIFISANPKWIQFVEDNVANISPPYSIAQNQLVLAVPVGRLHTLPSNVSGSPIAELIGNSRLAIADPSIAPAGQYAQSYLENLNIWDTLRPQIAFGTNARQTLLMIERGGLIGFVYHSDAKQSDLAKVAYVVPAELSGTIEYQGIQTDLSDKPAKAFLDFLTSSSAKPVWNEAGFR